MVDRTDRKVVAIESPQSEALLTLCKACADQLRLDILHVLSRDSFGVMELCSIFESKQSGMSHHLKILANAGIVTTRREGNSIFYRRSYRSSAVDADDSLNALQLALHEAIDQRPLCADVRRRVKLVQDERGASSQIFFSENADKFRQQQEQIADYKLYGANAATLLGNHFSSDKPAAKALEVGPGEGAFLAELAPRFKEVYALDNSQQMLEKAAEFVESSGLSNITFVRGDTKSAELRSLQVDCVVINMVLHHVASPAEIFFDMAAVLKRGGCLLVTDLCSHNQTWARESCGDLWLGFEPEDLTQWAINAGFKTAENIYLAQRNGFRVQIRQFIKL